MAENPTPTPTDPEPEPAPSEEGQETGQEVQDETPEAAGRELDADALRAEIMAARDEAARYRVKARDLRESLAKAKTPEEFEAAQARAVELETDLHRERLGRKYALPDALAARIGGEDGDAREADAKALAEAFHGKGGGVGRGGLDPSAKPVSKDPGELAAGIPRARR
ncbi:hypothetical protein ACIGW8_06060 [Streptomyces sioyaensis]|uniref:hypothetical protein n=1 Tax=Streptomyces sioyaensis TaxID=67364 RepID=UPI0037D0F7F7